MRACKLVDKTKFKCSPKMKVVRKNITKRFPTRPTFEEIAIELQFPSKGIEKRVFRDISSPRPPFSAFETAHRHAFGLLDSGVPQAIADRAAHCPFSF